MVSVKVMTSSSKRDGGRDCLKPNASACDLEHHSCQRCDAIGREELSSTDSDSCTSRHLRGPCFFCSNRETAVVKWSAIGELEVRYSYPCSSPGITPQEIAASASCSAEFNTSERSHRPVPHTQRHSLLSHLSYKT